MRTNAKLYDRDFYAWTREQAELMRAGRWAEADIDNIVEEIESMGRNERQRLESRLVVLLMHLAKWRFQPENRGRSWRLTIREQRLRIAILLRDNPSLRPVLQDIFDDAWPVATLRAQRETGLDEAAFPSPCPWNATDALDDVFWPE